MAFKQKIPLLGLILFAAAAAAALLFLRPEKQDLLRAAAEQYAGSLGASVRGVEFLGPVAVIALEPPGRFVYAEFAERDGAWAFSKDLAADFERAMADPAVEQQLLERLARRLSERFHQDISVKEGLMVERRLERDDGGLAGRFLILFAYPKVDGRQRRGRYLEIFRYRDGRWVSEGIGSLFDSGAAR